jgi:hypothetical protein
MKRCPRCNTGLPIEARFCWQCGAVQEEQAPPGRKNAAFRVDLSGNLEAQLNEQFFHALRERIEKEHDFRLFPEFSERLYTSGFRDALSRRTSQLAELIGEMADSGEAIPREVNAMIADLFEDLLDLFVIQHAQDLAGVKFPQEILKYQYAAKDSVPLQKMILDFLQLGEEGEEFYTDFLRMPLDKLKQAGKSFLFPAKDEKILLIADQSVLGGCKEGFAFTNRALYWKAPLQKARYVPFSQILDFRREENWITINSYFFNLSPAANPRMLRLLSRLQRLFSGSPG